jgi:predicted enzyme related to lactoylglutathione lyase
MKPQYFDRTVLDVEAARAFFEACLGWRFVPFEPIPGYYRIQAGSPDEPGIDGGVGAASDFPQSGGRPLTLLAIPVEDLDDVVTKVVSNGGRIVEPKREIPGVGWFATCAEPNGLLFGVFQPEPTGGLQERAGAASVVAGSDTSVGPADAGATRP